LLHSMSFFNHYPVLFLSIYSTYLLIPFASFYVILQSLSCAVPQSLFYLLMSGTSLCVFLKSFFYVLIPTASFYFVLQSLLFAVLQSLFYLLMSGSSFCVFLQQPVPVNSLLKGQIRFNTFLFVYPMFVLLRK
jgi:hypothetical protein